MKIADNSLKRIQRMRNGEKIECPICKRGQWEAVGDKKTTPLFQCDYCKVYMSLTIVKPDFKS